MPFPKCAKLDTRYTGVWKVLVTPPSYVAFCWESAWILLTLNSDEQKSLNSDVPAFSTNPISTATREGSRCLGAERQSQSPAWLMLITESGHLSHRVLTCHKQHRHPVKSQDPKAWVLRKTEELGMGWSRFWCPRPKWFLPSFFFLSQIYLWSSVSQSLTGQKNSTYHRVIVKIKWGNHHGCFLWTYSTIKCSFSSLCLWLLLW